MNTELTVGQLRRILATATDDATIPEALSELVYESFSEALGELGIQVETGVFGARMAVELVNDGPVTIVLEL